jgi:signal transduction histidine kinase
MNTHHDANPQDDEVPATAASGDAEGRLLYGWGIVVTVFYSTVLVTLAAAGWWLHENDAAASRLEVWYREWYPWVWMGLLVGGQALSLFPLGLSSIERHRAASRERARLNTEFRRHAAEHAQALATTLAKREAALRQRMLADMHDGLGASLVALLRYVQSGNANPSGIERRVKTSLQEMRIAVDALEPAEGDLGAVLGKLRFRLEPLLESTGVRLSWDVSELPYVEGLGPAAVFDIQRIVLEAIANALNHSAAPEIRIAVRAMGPEGVEINIEDDGKGFDPDAPGPGMGHTNMRARADRLGAGLEIISKPGHGTTVRLTVPLQIAKAADQPAESPHASIVTGARAAGTAPA